LVILIILGEEYKHEAPHYAVFINLLTLHLSSVQVFSSTSCSQTPSVKRTQKLLINDLLVCEIK
jgi:hypothetical protein